MKPLLEIKSLTKCYRNDLKSTERKVLDQLEFALEKGESAAIVGPSGSGKSTLLNLIGTLDRPDSGSIHFDGIDLSTLNEKAKNLYRNRDIGFVFQQHHLLPQHTVWENILIPTLPFGNQRKESFASVRNWASELLEICGLSDRREQRPGQLSGGECLRTALVRALINKPRLLLADEPTGSLDHVTAETICDLLVKINKEQEIALIVVTHAQFVARKMGCKFLLKNGMLVSEK